MWATSEGIHGNSQVQDLSWLYVQNLSTSYFSWLPGSTTNGQKWKMPPDLALRLAPMGCGLAPSPAQPSPRWSADTTIPKLALVPRSGVSISCLPPGQGKLGLEGNHTGRLLTLPEALGWAGLGWAGLGWLLDESGLFKLLHVGRRLAAQVVWGLLLG